jgi:hypothetical protein
MNDVDLGPILGQDLFSYQCPLPLHNVDVGSPMNDVDLGAIPSKSLLPQLTYE